MTFSIVILLISGAIMIICVRTWFSPESDRAVGQNVQASLRDGTFSGQALTFLSTVFDAILDHTFRRPNLWRFVAFSIALLCAALSLCDLKYNTMLGMKRYPWQSYNQAVAIMASATDRPLSAKQAESADMVRVHAEFQSVLHSAQRPMWKYVYTLVLACVVGVTNALFLLVSLLLSRHILREMSESTSWTVRCGLLLVLLVSSSALALSCTLLVGLLTSPAVWLVLILAKAIGSGVILVIGLLAALIFDWFFSGPCLEHLLL